MGNESKINIDALVNSTKRVMCTTLDQMYDLLAKLQQENDVLKAENDALKAKKE